MTREELTKHTFLIALNGHSSQFEHKSLPPRPEEVKELKLIKQMINELREGGLKGQNYVEWKELNQDLLAKREKNRTIIGNYYKCLEERMNENLSHWLYLEKMKGLFKDSLKIIEKINGVLRSHIESRK